MIILIKNNIEVYSANNINELTLKDNTCFFSNIDGNSNDCKFIGEYKDLINLGFVIQKDFIDFCIDKINETIIYVENRNKL